jgi:hypothetical protein
LFTYYISLMTTIWLSARAARLSLLHESSSKWGAEEHPPWGLVVLSIRWHILTSKRAFGIWHILLG